MSTLTSMDVCPINFNLFNEILCITKNLEATLLYSKLTFHIKNSKLNKNFVPYIVKTRKELGEWFGFSEKKIDSLLSILEEKNIINKSVGMWYGIKKLFISINDKSHNNHIPINLNLLNILKDLTGSYKSALIFSRIAFAFANTKINIANKRWCAITFQEFSNWSHLSERTINTLINKLKASNFIIKKNFNRNNKTQSHFGIQDDVIKKIFTLYKKNSAIKFDSKKSEQKTKNKVIHNYNCSSSKYCNQQSANLTFSINTVSNTKKIINNTVKTISPLQKIKYTRDINLINFEKNLNIRQKNYLFSALNKTITKFKLEISNFSNLKEELIFSIESKQHQGVLTFPHAVSRCMKILAERQWKTPKGFYKYSEKGKFLASQQNEQEQRWLNTKELEKNIKLNDTLNFFKNINEINITEKAVKIAQKIKELSQNSHFNSNDSIIHYTKNLISQLETLVLQGADISEIKSIMLP